MDETANLKLPYILAAQSQKHVTHNEALRALDAVVQLAVLDKDLSTPPGAPAEGDRYIVGDGASGAWAGHTTHVAAWQDGAWAFYVPVAGWLAWVDDESQSYLFSGGGWISAPGGGGASLVPKGAWNSAATYATGDLVEHEGFAFLSNVDSNLDNEPDADTPGSTSEWTYFAVVMGGGGGGGGGGDGEFDTLGINAVADTTNRLAVASPASLFSHDGAGHQLKINKVSAGETGSVLFQTGFSGRAEFGLAGDDDFHVKVSADGSTWHEAMVISRTTGSVSLPNTAGGGGGGREVLSANRTYYVRTDGDDANNGLANTSGGAFLTMQKAVDTVASLDLGICDATIKVADGTYTTPVVLKTLIGAGECIIEGNTTTPANVVISTTNSHAILGDGAIGRFFITGVRITTAGSIGHGIGANGAGLMVRWAAVEFGSCINNHVDITRHAVGRASGSYEIIGGGQRHIRTLQNGIVQMAAAAVVTVTGTPNFSQEFVLASQMSGVFAAGVTFSGAATGQRYEVNQNSAIFTGSGGANFFPGNAAGAAALGGIYA